MMQAFWALRHSYVSREYTIMHHNTQLYPHKTLSHTKVYIVDCTTATTECNKHSSGIASTILHNKTWFTVSSIHILFHFHIYILFCVFLSYSIVKSLYVIIVRHCTTYYYGNDMKFFVASKKKKHIKNSTLIKFSILKTSFNISYGEKIFILIKPLEYWQSHT